MGLFSFVKSAGRKMGLFGGEQAAEAEAEVRAALEAAQGMAEDAERLALERKAAALDIRAAIQSHGIVVEGLEIGFDGEIVTMSGTASSRADKEKAILIAGNTEGVAAVDEAIAVEVPEPPAIHHTVVPGDSLSKIALANYGSMQLYEHVFEANTPMLKHPDAIYPGQVLRIPRVATATHTVRPGDTLGKIARFHYGAADRYEAIFQANTDRLSSPDAIEVGQELVIPLSGPAVDPTIA